MADVTRDLMKLRPVLFIYKNDSSNTPQIRSDCGGSGRGLPGIGGPFRRRPDRDRALSSV